VLPFPRAKASPAKSDTASLLQYSSVLSKERQAAWHPQNRGNTYGIIEYCQWHPSGLLFQERKQKIKQTGTKKIFELCSDFNPQPPDHFSSGSVKETSKTPIFHFVAFLRFSLVSIPIDRYATQLIGLFIAFYKRFDLFSVIENLSFPWATSVKQITSH